jgi:sugar phosphate permease
MIASFGSVVMGVSSTVTGAMVGRALVGLGVGMVFVPTMKILTQWFHTKEFSMMASVMLGMGGLGALSAATPLVWLNSLIGWRSAFMVVGGMTLALALIVWVCVRNAPSDLGWPPPYKSMPELVPSGGNLLKNVGIVLSTPLFWPLAVWFFCNIGIFFALGGLWGGPYLQHVYHLDKVQTGQVLSTISVGLVLGNPLFSFLSDRVFHRRKAVIILANVVLIVVIGVFYLKTNGIPLPLLYLLFFVFSVFSVALTGIGFTLNKEMFPVEMSGTATGLINLFPFAGGAFFQPVLGRVLENSGKINGMFTLTGYRQAFLVLWVAAGISLVASVFIRETSKNTP